MFPQQVPDKAVVRAKFENFFQKYPLQTYTPGQRVIDAGSKLNFLFYIKDGCVKMSTTSLSGESLSLHVFYPGSCFSLLGLTSSFENRYDFEAITEVQIYRAPQDQVMKFIQENSDISYELMVRMLFGLRGLLDRVEQSVFVSAYHRVASLLLYFVTHFAVAQSDEKSLSIKITHQDIAEWLGLSRENVSIQMKKLEREGFLSKKNGLLHIYKVAELKELVEENLSIF
jgi:CRP-like cAMP-binding protein